MNKLLIPMLLLLNTLLLLLILIIKEKNTLIDVLSECCQELEDELFKLKK